MGAAIFNGELWLIFYQSEIANFRFRFCGLDIDDETSNLKHYE